jgi:hypothetical protein
VQRAQQAEAYQLADQAEAHLSKLMGQGRDCWQALTELGIQDKQLKEEIQALPTNKNNKKQTSMEDLETAWKNFEANQALENLKKEQQK